MSRLEVPGAQIYHEVVGKGPLLLCISGGNGAVDGWRRFADSLKDHFTVVAWDRRGFSRSNLTDAQDYSRRLERDVEDAVCLIEKYSPDSPATVLGNSSGAVIALKLLIMHPDLIRTLIPYEPPAAKLCPDYDWIWSKHEEAYSAWQNEGPFPAFKLFAEVTKSKGMDWLKIDLSQGYLWQNMQYWFEREFMQYPKVDFDIERDFRPHVDKLMPVHGETSPKDAYQVKAMTVATDKLGLEYHVLPGDHVGHQSHPKEFAEKLLETLKAKDKFYVDL